MPTTKEYIEMQYNVKSREIIAYLNAYYAAKVERLLRANNGQPISLRQMRREHHLPAWKIEELAQKYPNRLVIITIKSGTKGGRPSACVALVTLEGGRPNEQA